MNPQEIQKVNQLYKQLDQVTQENEQLKANAATAGWDQIASDIDQVKQQVEQLVQASGDILDTLDKSTSKTRKK
jgi:ABC-type transporter Mla subunit MlaD